MFVIRRISGYFLLLDKFDFFLRFTTVQHKDKNSGLEIAENNSSFCTSEFDS